MRIRGAKTELEEAGLETDGMAESTSKLREEILALSGVDIMIDDSTFKSTYDIVLELAKVWDTMSDVSQANVSELLAGKRGGNVINALMTNADLLEETYATALGSEGSAEKELENYQQGVEYSIGVFKASWEELSNTILSSDLLKTVIDIGSGFLSTINSITSALGGFNTTLAAIPIVAFLTNFKNLKNIGNDFLGNATSGFNIVGETTASTKGVNGLTAAMTGLGVKVKDVAKSFASTAGFGGAVAAVAGVGLAINLAISYMNRFNDSVETAVTSLNDFQTEQETLNGLESQSEDIKSTLEDLANTYSVDISGLDDVNSIIDKIESVDGIKITDKATLEDLRGENTELERQIALQEKVVEQSQQKAESDAMDVVTMKSTPDLTQGTTSYTLFGEGVETYATEDVITATKNELDALARLYDARNQGIEDFVDADTKLTINDIGALEDNISSQIEAMDSVKESLTSTEAGRAYYDQIIDLENQFASIDLSPLGRQLASLDTYFSTDGMDAVKNAILNAVSAGETASDVFERMGLSLADIGSGVSADTFDAYFDDLVSGAEEAEEAINSVEGTLESMQAAADTSNQNANWESAAKLLSDAKDLYENGLVGTDDFKEAVQYLTKNPINPDEAQFEFDSDAYVAAWEKAQDKVNRYFNADNPIQSMQNTLDDLVNAGLATDEGEGLYEWTEGFKNTAQAADAFGLSIAATEDLLNGLKAYGFEFDDVFFSGQGLEEYENALEGIRSIYDSMAEGDTKTRMGEMLSDFDTAKDTFEDDISQLDKEAIVHIQFEYDLAQLKADVENARQASTNLGDTSESQAAILGAQQNELTYLRNQTGLAKEGVEIPVKITDIDDQISKLESQLKNATEEEEKVEIQAEIENLQDLEANLMEAFEGSEYAVDINGDSSIADIEEAWSSFLGSVDGQDLVANIDLNDEQAIAFIQELTGLSEEEIKLLITADTTQAITNIEDVYNIVDQNGTCTITMQTDASIDSIKAQIEALKEGNVIEFTANIDGVDTLISGVKNEKGVMEYSVSADVDTSKVEGAISDITGEEEPIVIPVDLDTDEAQSRKRGLVEEDNTIEATEELDTNEAESKERGFSSRHSTIEATEELDTSEAESEKEKFEGSGGTVDETVNYDDSQAEGEKENFEEGGTVEETAEFDGSEIEGAKEQEGVITFTSDTSAVESAISEYKEQEGTFRFTADTTNITSVISEFKQQEGTIKFTGDASGVESAISGYKEQEGTIKFTANASGVSSAIAGYKQQTGTITYTANTEGISSALASVLTINGTATVTFSADTSAPESYQPSDKDATVVFNKDSSIPDNYQPTDKTATVHYSADTSALPTSFPSLTRTVNYVATGATSANGTAHANGTATTLPRLSGNAKASGDVDEWSTEINDRWRTKKGETTLTGELGRELVVDVNHNRWFTVGDNGAEFAYIPAGSVVFNNQQTEDLLTTGSTEGTAHAQGTAYANGGRLITSSSSSSSSKSSSSSSSSKSSSSSSSSSKKSSSSSSKKKSSSSSSSSKDFEESLDWIEIEIDRIERAIDRLDLKAESTYNNWTTRNKNLADEIAKINEEISIQQKAYDRYIQQANSVGLSSKYVTLVQNGAIDISTITDEDLADQIKEYQEWYEKALDCKDAIDELTESVKSLYEEAFQNIQDEFDAIINVYEHQANMLEGYIKQTEAQGYITSTQYYTALIENEEEQLNYLEEERTRLVNALNDAVKNGGIDEYSESWYNMCAEIDKVDEAIQDATTSIIEFGNSIRDIEWEIFDLIEDNISHITTEADFLIDLMSSRDMYDTDTGEITDVGRATFGLHAVNYNTYMEQADDYAEEIKNIDKELANDPYNQDLLDRRQELLELQQQSILSAEDEKQAIKDLVEDGINAELDALQNLIDEYTDLLDTEKDMYDYSKKIAEQQKNISSLEKQLSAYQGDTSEEGAARRQKLQNELNEAQEELEQTQYEQAIAETKKLLNDLYDEYEKILNERLDDIDMLISDVITNVNADSELIYETIQEQAEAVGYTISDSMNTVWESQKDVVTGYCENFTSSLTGIQTSINDIKALVQKQVDASNKTASSNVKTATTSATTSTKTSTATTASSSTSTSTSKSTQGDGTVQVGDKVTYNSGKYYNDSYGSSPSGSKYQGKSVYVTKIVSSPKSGQNYPIHISTGSKLGNGDLGWLKKSQISGYASGTKSVKDDELSEINEKGREIVVSGGNPTLVDLKRGDGVISNKLTENLMDWGAVTPQDVLEHLNPEIRTNKQMDVDKNVEVNIAIDKVEDYNDFIRQLQNDDKAERLIQSICYGEVTGRGKLGKYNVKLD